jgi:hypothetical protein
MLTASRGLRQHPSSARDGRATNPPLAGFQNREMSILQLSLVLTKQDPSCPDGGLIGMIIGRFPLRRPLRSLEGQWRTR